jgi:hypothetical protein
MDEFILAISGEMFVNLPVNTIDAVFEDTNFKTPLIFILSPGADPLFNLQVKQILK